jgi:hypothetical protein
MHNNNYIYPSIPYLQARTDNGIIGTDNGIIGTDNGIIGTLNGIIGTENGIIGTENGIIGERHYRYPSIPYLQALPCTALAMACPAAAVAKRAVA